MVLASDVKEGTAVQLDGKLFKVLEVIRHAGSGQMHGFIEVKMKDLRFGHIADRRFKQTDRFEEVLLAKRQMEYLYADQESCYFMDPETFEQVGVPKPRIGTGEKFLHQGSRIVIELLGEEAMSVQLPKNVELKVASTGPGRREGQDNTLKAATLENGVEILVPQFIDNGDVIRIDTEKMKYIDRVGRRRM